MESHKKTVKLRPLSPPFRPTRRQLLQAGFALTAAALLPGCGTTDGANEAGSAPGTPAPVTPAPAANPQPMPSGPVTEASVTVTDIQAGAICPAFAGLSYEKDSMHGSLFSAANSDLIGLLQRLGPSVLRVGGNSVDQNVWTPNGAGNTAGQIAPSEVASLAAFVKAAGWQCLYAINLGGAASGATTPALAAEEVAYAAEQFGSSLLGIEIGNEPDCYGLPGSYFAGDWSLARFLTLWAEYRTAILNATPGVPITGAAASANYASWTVPFGLAVGKNEITLLTQHYYRADGQSPTSTANFLITPDPALIADLAILNAGAEENGIPYRMSECNSFYDGGAVGVSDSYASTLWSIDFLFDCAQGGASGVNFHGGGDSGGYTPIADSGGRVVNVRPEYYGMLLFTLAGQGTLRTTEVSAGSLNVTAYAVEMSAGGLNLVVVNKDSVQNLKLTAQLPQSIQSASLLEMTQLLQGATGAELTATGGISIQGAAVSVNGGFSPGAPYTLDAAGSQLTCYVPALSAVLIQIV